MNEFAPDPAVPPSPASGLGALGRLFVLAALAGGLLISLTLVYGVLRERSARCDAAVEEITSTWGGRQLVAGPILTIPYRSKVVTWKERPVGGRVERSDPVTEYVMAEAHFLPKVLTADVRLDPQLLHRGIYRAVVYGGDIELSGSFDVPSFDEWKIDPADILWDDAYVSIAVPDLRGASEMVSLVWDGTSHAFEPGTRLTAFPAGMQARLRGTSPMKTPVTFKIGLRVNGSEGLRIAPVGRSTQVKIASSWPDPAFRGSVLPNSRTVGPAGFEAAWKLSYYGRSYAQQWIDKDNDAPDSSRITDSSVGVDLLDVVSGYRGVERAIKYGAIFIVLVFAAFFLFEVLSTTRIHPFQYLLTGCALVLFYLALLALSEFISFSLAYLCGATASTLLISAYCAGVLQGRGRAVVMGIGLAAVYGFLFVILQLQDFSLLVGTAGLFVALALVMFLTRNVRWYGPSRGNLPPS